MRTGWQKLIPPDNYDEESSRVVPGYDSAGGSDDGRYWFISGQMEKSTCRMTVPPVTMGPAELTEILLL